MAKRPVTEHEIDRIPRVTVHALARSLGVSADSARYAMDQMGATERDWRGVPSIPASVARQIYEGVQADRDREFRERQEADRRRKARENFIKEEHSRLFGAHPDIVRFNSRPVRGLEGKERQLVRQINAETHAQAVKEADKRGL